MGRKHTHAQAIPTPPLLLGERVLKVRTRERNGVPSHSWSLRESDFVAMKWGHAKTLGGAWNLSSVLRVLLMKRMDLAVYPFYFGRGGRK